jgi:hypothetical protein
MEFPARNIITRKSQQCLARGLWQRTRTDCSGPMQIRKPGLPIKQNRLQVGDRLAEVPYLYRRQNEISRFTGRGMTKARPTKWKGLKVARGKCFGIDFFIIRREGTRLQKTAYFAGITSSLKRFHSQLDIRNSVSQSSTI